MQEVITHSPEETMKVAAEMVLALSREEGVRGTSTIIALQGDLGAGKTVFAKGVARHLGLTEDITSPTFVIQKTYTLPEGKPWKRLVHIDAYRLDSEAELSTIGWHDLATDPDNLILVEWPEQVGAGVPERAYHIEFQEIDENTRRISLDRKFKM